MDRKPVKIGKELRCGDWTRRASDSSGQSVLYHLKFMMPYHDDSTNNIGISIITEKLKIHSP